MLNTGGYSPIKTTQNVTHSTTARLLALDFTHLGLSSSSKAFGRTGRAGGFQMGKEWEIL